MLKQASNFKPNQVAETVLAASRQVWLAGLGAAAISRDWAQHRASDVFKGLVKQGSAVESQAIRVIGSRVETSIETAGALWNQARRTVISTVSTVAENAAAAMPRTKHSAPKRVHAAKPRNVARTVKAARKPGRRQNKRAK
jgi:hypothetical protein